MKTILNTRFLLFANIAKKKWPDYQAAHPDADIIRLGIGDVTLPLVPTRCYD